MDKKTARQIDYELNRIFCLLHEREVDISAGSKNKWDTSDCLEEIVEHLETIRDLVEDGDMRDAFSEEEQLSNAMEEDL